MRGYSLQATDLEEEGKTTTPCVVIALPDLQRRKLNVGNHLDGKTIYNGNASADKDPMVQCIVDMIQTQTNMCEPTD